MKFHIQFTESPVPISVNSGRQHKNFVDEAPLSPSEMMRRAINGIPLSVPKPKDDKIPLNNRFYNDDFDVLDVIIQRNAQLTEEAKKRQLEENEKRKLYHEEFEAWKKEREASLNNLPSDKPE